MAAALPTAHIQVVALNLLTWGPVGEAGGRGPGCGRGDKGRQQGMRGAGHGGGGGL